MAITLIASGSASSGNTTHNAGTPTLTAGRLYIIMLGAENFGPVQTWSAAQTGATWTVITHGGASATATRTCALRCRPESTISGQSLTLNSTQTAAPSWAIIEVDNPNTGGTNGSGAIQQLPTGEDDSTNTLTINYPNAWQDNSYGLAGFVLAGGGINSTPRDGWSELFDNAVGGVRGFAVHARTTPDTAASANFGSTNGKSGIALEILTAEETPPGPYGPDNAVDFGPNNPNQVESGYGNEVRFTSAI